MKRILILLAIVVGVVLFIGYNYVYQDHRNIEEEAAAFTVSATDLAKEFTSNADEASKKYLNKTILVTGELTEIEDNSLMINEAVYITFDAGFDNSLYSLKSLMKVKGRCIGYDELLEVIKLDQAVVEK